MQRKCNYFLLSLSSRWSISNAREWAWNRTEKSNLVLNVASVDAAAAVAANKSIWMHRQQVSNPLNLSARVRLIVAVDELTCIWYAWHEASMIIAH